MKVFQNLFGSLKQKIFWRWFKENSESIFETVNGREPIIDELEHQLKRVQVDLVFEIGPTQDDGRRELVISGDGVKRAFPAVHQLIATAPEHPKWKYTAFRQALPQRLSIHIEGYELSSDEIWFTHQKNEDGEREDFTLYIQNLSPENERLATVASFILLDSLIGEYLVAIRIGTIERKPMPENRELLGVQPFHEIRVVLGLKSENNFTS